MHRLVPICRLKARAAFLTPHARATAGFFDLAAVAALADTVPVLEADALARLVGSTNQPPPELRA
jgi:hypothetical protein